jgi:penicillin-binding protein 1B
VLGQRGPFEIHGVSEAARIFFGKDVRNITLAEAATIAGVIQSPSRLSPFRNPDRARERRNVVLDEMATAGVVTREAATKAEASPLVVSTRALENEAPYFVDYASQLVDEDYAGLLKSDAAVDVYTTLDLHLQRMAQEALNEGLTQVDKQLAARKRKGTAQAALVAVDPRTGDILAMVGGRAYNQSQYNRAVAAKRQPGSVFKPFVYLSAFQSLAETGQPDLTPATVIADEPTTFKDGENDYTPSNYQNEYDGPITLRRALALSRNIVAIKVAEQVGYDKVVDLWKKAGVGTPARAYPSIALGVFEVSPVEMTSAYTIFANNGTMHPLRALTSIVENGKTRAVAAPAAKTIARPDATYLVVNMMRSVMNEGTGAAARSAGFTLDAAGKSGTTNDLRDAWFIGLTPELLTAVWVGFDNNQPIGLSGSQAALPIWTSFMKRALAGRPSASFDVPEGVVFADIDKDTGQLATPACPSVIHEAFLAGTEPHQTCELHGPHGFLSTFGGWFGIGR